MLTHSAEYLKASLEIWDLKLVYFHVQVIETCAWQVYKSFKYCQEPLVVPKCQIEPIIYWLHVEKASLQNSWVLLWICLRIDLKWNITIWLISVVINVLILTCVIGLEIEYRLLKTATMKFLYWCLNFCLWYLMCVEINNGFFSL